MAKKQSTVAAGLDNQIANKVRESAQQIWNAGLGAFAKAQHEGNKVFEALVSEGEVLQEKTRSKVAGLRVTEMANKATGTWDKLEQVFEARVARALGSLGVPTRKEIDALNKRIDRLAEQLDKKPTIKASVSKSASKPVAARAKKAVA